MSSATPEQAPRPWWIWAWAIAVLPLVGFWTTGLFDLDEGFYGAVTAEMNRRGEWIVPYYNGAPWFEKPILLYWVAKVTSSLFGSEVGMRLPSVLAALGTLAWVASFVRRRAGDWAGIFSLVVLGTSLLFAALGRMMMTDMLLTFALTGCYLLFYDSLEGRPRLRWGAGAMLGVAVLAKGPVGGAIFLVLAAWTFWREPTLRDGFRGGWLGAIVAFLIVTASWYVPAYLRTGDVFVQQFLIEQNVGRFTGGDVAHTLTNPLAYLLYLPILLLGMLPWSLWIPVAAKRGWASGPIARYLGAWATIVLVLFSLSGAKLPNYILPALPPLAMLVGMYYASTVKAARIPRAAFMMSSWGVLVALMLNVGMWWYYERAPKPHKAVHDLARIARDSGETVTVFRMSRQEEDRGTGTTDLRDTHHPSVVMIVDRVLVQSDRLDDILAQPVPIQVLTREGRFRDDDLAELDRRGLSLQDVTPPGTVHYRLYRIAPKVSGQ